MLTSFLSGKRLPEIAPELGISDATVRAHLDNIFAKPGVTRQAELMLVAMRIVPPATAKSAGVKSVVVARL
jgi:DNA-binding CsgD family transcriptional regulator